MNPYNEMIKRFKAEVSAMSDAELFEAHDNMVNTFGMWDYDPDKEKEDEWNLAICEEIERRANKHLSYRLRSSFERLIDDIRLLYLIAVYKALPVICG